MDRYEDLDSVFSWNITGDSLTLNTVEGSQLINMQKWKFKVFYITVSSSGTYVRIMFRDGTTIKFEIDPSMLDKVVPLFKKFAMFVCEIGKKIHFNVDIDSILKLDDEYSYDDIGNEGSDDDKKLCLTYHIKKTMLYVQSQCTFMFLDLSSVNSFTYDTSLTINFDSRITFYSDLSLVNLDETREYVVSQMKNMKDEINILMSKPNKCVIL